MQEFWKSSQEDTLPTTEMTSFPVTSPSSPFSPSQVPFSHYEPGECYSQRPSYAASGTTFPLVYIILLMVIALTGNSLVLFIYNCRWRSRGTMKVYVSALAMLDIFSSLSVMPRDLVTFTLASPRTLGIHSPDALCQVVTYAGFLLHFSSGFILVTIAASRHFKVTGSPIRGIGKLTRFVNTYRGARLTSVAVIVIASIVTFPSLLLYKNNPEMPCFLQVQNQSSFLTSVSNCYLECTLNPEASHKVFVMIFLIFSLIVFSSIFLSLISLYLAVGYHLRASEKDQPPCSPHNPEVVTKGRTDLQKPVEERTPSVSTEEPETTVHSFWAKRGNTSHTSTDQDESLHFPVSYSFNAISSAPPTPREDIENRECKSNMQDYFLPSVRDTKQKMTKTKRKTLMMMIITVIFILSYLPFLSLSIANQVTGGLCSKMSPNWLMTSEVFWRSFYISNAANPIVYGFCNPTFRKVLWKTLSWRAEII